MSGLSIKAKELEINPDDPFEDDALGRKEIATVLTNLVKDEENPLVVGLHGSWGTGKTYLLRRWQQELKNNDFQAIYFSAWEDDFCDDPLVSIIGQLTKEIDNADYGQYKEHIQGCAIPLLASFAKVQINRFIDTEDLKESTDKLFEQYTNARDQQDKLHKQLTNLALAVREKTKHPLIFIIDELDRCRPTFAISLLERIKHLFNVPNIVFVLGIDRKQLEISIESVYGSEMDTENYLRRFIDMNFRLPEPDHKQFTLNLLLRYDLEYSFNYMKIDLGNKEQILGYDFFKNFYASLANHLQLTLREIEDSTRIFIFMARSMKGNSFVPPDFLALLLLVRVKDKKLYYNYLYGDSTEHELLELVDQSTLNSKQGSVVLATLGIRLSIINLDTQGAKDLIRIGFDSLRKGHSLGLRLISSESISRKIDSLEEHLLESILTTFHRELHNNCISPRDTKEQLCSLFEFSVDSGSK